jgi:hypothetical protein
MSQMPWSQSFIIYECCEKRGKKKLNRRPLTDSTARSQARRYLAPLSINRQKQLLVNGRREEINRGDIRGMQAVPAGSMDGVYRSIFPKLFFGIFPYVRGILLASP